MTVALGVLGLDECYIVGEDARAAGVLFTRVRLPVRRLPRHEVGGARLRQWLRHGEADHGECCEQVHRWDALRQRGRASLAGRGRAKRRPCRSISGLYRDYRVQVPVHSLVVFFSYNASSAVRRVRISMITALES
eukprot:COSAG02_NODE_1641_length_11530_cov_4.345289_9_plen_135_part_00